MSKTQYFTATSLDGYIADRDNSLEWLFAAERENPDRDGAGTRFTDFFSGVGAMCMGATTYEWVLAHEKLLEQPERWRGYYGDTPCWVFTHRELPAIPGVDIRFVAGDVAVVHEQMSAAAGGANIWVVGGGDLAGQFADRNLLDEIIVGVVPVTLGGGAPLLPRSLPASRLRLTTVVQDGQFVQLSYAVGAR